MLLARGRSLLALINASFPIRDLEDGTGRIAWFWLVEPDDIGCRWSGLGFAHLAITDDYHGDSGGEDGKSCSEECDVGSVDRPRYLDCEPRVCGARRVLEYEIVVSRCLD